VAGWFDHGVDDVPSRTMLDVNDRPRRRQKIYATTRVFTPLADRSSSSSPSMGSLPDAPHHDVLFYPSRPSRFRSPYLTALSFSGNHLPTFFDAMGCRRHDPVVIT